MYMAPDPRAASELVAKLASPVKVPTNSPWLDPRTVLFYLALISITLLAIPPLVLACARVWQAVNVYLVSRRVHRSDETAPLLTDSLDAAAEDDEVVLVPPPRAESRVLPAGSGSLSGDLQLHVASLGGWVVFGLHLLRLLACLSLVGLTLWAIVIDAEDSADPEDDGNVGVLKKGHRHGGRKKGRKGERRREAFGREEIVEILQCCFFIYCAMLALVTAILPRLRLLKTHLTVLLLAAFLLAAYRNLLPLVLGRKPLDIILHHLKGIHDPLWDTLVWLRVGLLGLAGVILPLILLLRSSENRHTLRYHPLAIFRQREERPAEHEE